MKRVKIFVKVGLSAVFGMIFVSSSLARQDVMHGLSTKFASIILTGLKPGMVFSFKEQTNLPFKVINKASSSEDLEVIAEIPEKRHLKEGYEPIPDPSWIKIHPSQFKLGPEESANCDIIISIPEGKEYENRHFQASIVAQTAARGGPDGVAMSFAMQTKLRFSTGPSLEAVLREYQKKVLEALKITVEPMSLYLSDVPLGEEIELGSGSEYSTIRLGNFSEETYKLKFKIPKNLDSYGISKDYKSAPDMSWLKLKKGKMKIKGGRIESIGMSLKIPDKEEYRDKNFAFVVVAEILDLDVPVSVFGRVYIKTRR